MPYNEHIEKRILNIISDWDNTDRKKMFGGICHLIQGNMFCGVYKDLLILRLGVEGAGKALETPFVRPFDITGRPMKGWVMVEEQGFRTEQSLRKWLEQAKAFASTLPPK
ncbi:MAG: TfoX/Sxy family protein [Desulfomonilaceae bacterium]|nr:TfoX/Sxy family protein [Desulfomonilaceae bacterium]